MELEQVEVNGRTVYIRKGNDNDRAIIREIYQENVYQLKPGDVSNKVIVDIGANIGIFSLYCWQHGAKRVIAYEPEPHNLEIFKRNCDQEIELHETAIAQTPYILLSNDGGGSHAVQKGGSRCPAVTLFNALENLDRVDVLKMDIEGGEYQALTYAPAETLDKIQYLTMEYHGTDRETFGAMIAELSTTFNLHFFGSYKTGGMLYGRHF